MVPPDVALTLPHAGLVAALRKAADEAMDRLGQDVMHFDVAGLILRVRCAGPALRDLTRPSLAHAAIAAAEPDLDVAVWDSGRSGVVLPAEAGRPADHTPYGFARVRQQGPWYSYFDPWTCSLTALDLERGEAAHWLPDGSTAPDGMRSAPFQALLNWWLPARGRAVIHGAAVGTEHGAVLLLGPSSAGKSTTALACVDSGFDYLGDDLCAITLESTAVVHRVYGSAKLLDADLARLPRLAPSVVNTERGPTQKAIVYPDRGRPDAIRLRRPLRAVLLLTAKGRPAPELEPVTAAAGLRLIAPGIFLNFPGHGQPELAALARLVAQVPCYRMGLAADLEANPRALRALLEAPA